MWGSAEARSGCIFIGWRTNPLSISERMLIPGSIAVPAPAIALALTVPGARRRPAACSEFHLNARLECGNDQ